MFAASDIAEWWDEQHRVAKKELDAFVDDNPGLFGVIVATAVATAMEVGAGTVDVLRLGEGVAEGGLAGFGKDALRVIGIAGPIGKAAKLAQAAKGVKVAKLISDPGGPICAWVSATKALRQVGQKTFAAVDDLLEALGHTSFKVVYQISDVLEPLRKIGAEVVRLKVPKTIDDVRQAVPRDGSVVMFFVDWANKLQAGTSRHALYAFYDHLGRFRIADRTGNVVESLQQLDKLVPGYGGIGSAVTSEMALIKNVFMKFVGPKGAATLSMAVLAELAADPETVAQAFEVRKEAGKPRASNVRYHTVVSGDWLSKLAKTYYGDMYKWPVIYEANRKMIGANPNLIHPGLKLWIPELPKVSAAKPS